MFTFYGLAIAIASRFNYENICLTELHCYGTYGKKLFIDIMITICSQFSAVAGSKQVCEYGVTSFSCL